MSDHRIYTLWASLKEDPGPWLIAAEDDHAWEGDPDRCEAAFKAAREKAEKDNFEVREITVLVPYENIVRAFEVPEVDGLVEESGG